MQVRYYIHSLHTFLYVQNPPLLCHIKRIKEEKIMATINGYGIELTTAYGFSYEKYKELIKAHMPNLKKKAEKSEAAEWVFNGCKDYLSSSKKGMVLANVDACLNSGITPAAFLSNIMFLETGVRFSAYNDAEDYDVSAGVVMFEENFPWLMTEFERNMTQQVLDDIFAKYIAELVMDVRPDHICIDTDI